MSELHIILKVAHIIGACVLLGTGMGIAFFMWMANRTGEAGIIAATARIVVIADAAFTATAIVIQPVTGAALAGMAGISARLALDRLVAGALRSGGRLLASRGVDPDQAAQSRPRGGGRRQAAAPGVPSPVPRPVHSRLARLRGGRRDHRPDDCQANVRDAAALTIPDSHKRYYGTFSWTPMNMRLSAASRSRPNHSPAPTPRIPSAARRTPARRSPGAWRGAPRSRGRCACW
jgi:Predicted integral membrane protein (DUF2269)